MNWNYPRLARVTRGCGLASLLAGLAASGASAVAQTTTFSGRAVAIDLGDIHQPEPGPIIVADTGALPSAGGNLSTSVGAQNFFNGDLTLQGANASASGSGSQSLSQTSLTGLFIRFMDAAGGINTLTLDSAAGTASATCTGAGATVSGSTQVAGLAINGQAVAVTGEVNQTIAFNGFTLTLNEQIRAASGNTGDITVNAIHIAVPGCMNGVISSAHADINCGGGPPPGCPECVDPQFGLGAAGGFNVLELTNATVSITGPAGGIIGDIGIGPNGTLSMSGDEYVTGLIRLSPGAKFNNSSHGTVHVQYNADLNDAIHDAYAAYANAQAQACTQTFVKLDGGETITGSVGLNVICVQDIVLSGKQIYLSGPAGAKFLFKVSGKFTLTGGGAGPQIRVTGGLQPKDVLYVILGSGSDVAFSGGGGGTGCCAAIVDGTLLAPYRKIALSPGLVNGEVISGMNISIVSGSSVRCPQCP